MSAREHYDKAYFEWQKSVGMFGGHVNLVHFKDYCQPDFNVIDFGCGGGYLLSNLTCKERIGIEINPRAQDEVRAKGITVYSKAEEVTNEWADLVISDNALEHTLHPFSEIKQLYLKLKKGGLIVFVVPCESIGMKYRHNDVNQHLYSWSPMCIGNLFGQAGFNVISSKAYYHKWPPYFYTQIRQLLGGQIFEFLCRICGRISRSWIQVRIVARKPE